MKITAIIEQARCHAGMPMFGYLASSHWQCLGGLSRDARDLPVCYLIRKAAQVSIQAYRLHQNYDLSQGSVMCSSGTMIDR